MKAREKVALTPNWRRLQSAANILKKCSNTRAKHENVDVAFDITHWATEGRSCGTTACALGFLAMTRNFKRVGLFLGEMGHSGSNEYRSAGIRYKRDNAKLIVGGEELWPNSSTMHAATYVNIDAAMALFGVSRHVASDFFMPGTYKDKNGKIMENRLITPKMVARKIEQYIRKNHKIA